MNEARIDVGCGCKVIYIRAKALLKELKSAIVFIFTFVYQFQSFFTFNDSFLPQQSLQ